MIIKAVGRVAQAVDGIEVRSALQVAIEQFP